MQKFLTAVVWIPLGAILIVFAIANRHSVTVSLDPFNSTDPSGGVTMPLFAVIIAVAILGVLAGGITTWLRQHHWRRSSRRYQADAIEARAQLVELRASLANASGPRQPQRQPMLLERDARAASERDKYDATL
jgi:uncharacterized integral membrane protein